MMEFVFTILPYFTILLFTLGIIWRAYRFRDNVASNPIFPYASSSLAEKVSTYSKQILLFTPLFKNDRKLWLASWLFHLSLALIVIGHIRMFLGIKIDERIAFALGTFFGLMFLATMLFLLARRFEEVKVISTLEDYFALFLLLSIAATGLAMRFSGEYYDFSGYLASLINFTPKAPEYDLVLATHALLAQLLIIYLPYGKLFHSIGAFVTSYLPLRWQE
jgi:nitrate reductase gamma subunit